MLPPGVSTSDTLNPRIYEIRELSFDLVQKSLVLKLDHLGLHVRVMVADTGIHVVADTHLLDARRNGRLVEAESRDRVRRVRLTPERSLFLGRGDVLEVVAPDVRLDADSAVVVTTNCRRLVESCHAFVFHEVYPQFPEQTLGVVLQVLPAWVMRNDREVADILKVEQGQIAGLPQERPRLYLLCHADHNLSGFGDNTAEQHIL